LKGVASQVIVAHGGTISHQHGVGLDHAPYLEAEKGPLGMRALETVLKTFDPQNLLNPGKLLA
jgi:alkyldihydroxyacetonephosphate synthase